MGCGSSINDTHIQPLQKSQERFYNPKKLYSSILSNHNGKQYILPQQKPKLKQPLNDEFIIQINKRNSESNCKNISGRDYKIAQRSQIQGTLISTRNKNKIMSLTKKLDNQIQNYAKESKNSKIKPIQITALQKLNSAQIKQHLKILKSKKKNNHDPGFDKYCRIDRYKTTIDEQIQQNLQEINLEMMDCQLTQNSICDETLYTNPSQGMLYIRKMPKNNKNQNQKQKISKTSITINPSSQNISQQDLRNNFYKPVNPQISIQLTHQQEAINTAIARAQRNIYLQQKKKAQSQKNEQKKKWERQLKEGATILNRQFSNRYRYLNFL